MDVESIITGLILIDVAATIGGNWMTYRRLEKLGTRLTVIETQHNQNHKMEVQTHGN